MANIFLIHGAYGNPDENWLPWLKEELEKLGNKVYVPKFPTPEGQSLKSWMDAFKDYEKYVDEGSIFVGHSLGPAFILHILEKHKARAAFFVAGFISKLGKEEFDSINITFFKEFDWESIRNSCKKFYVYNSDKDPYVPVTKAGEIAEKLSAEVIEIEGAGHFNEKAGYKKFDILLDNIKNELGQ